jgi:hypothetical protein
MVGGAAKCGAWMVGDAWVGCIDSAIACSAASDKPVAVA